MQELAKLTPAMRKALEASEQHGSFQHTAAPINVWATPDGRIEVAPATIRKLKALGLLYYPNGHSAHITNLGRETLSRLRNAEADALNALRTSPLSKSESPALAALLKYGSLYQHVSGSWSDLHGNSWSYVSRTMNLLIARGYAVKISDSRIDITDAGRKAAEELNG